MLYIHLEKTAVTSLDVFFTDVKYSDNQVCGNQTTSHSDLLQLPHRMGLTCRRYETFGVNTVRRSCLSKMHLPDCKDETETGSGKKNQEQ